MGDGCCRCRLRSLAACSEGVVMGTLSAPSWDGLRARVSAAPAVGRPLPAPTAGTSRNIQFSGRGELMTSPAVVIIRVTWGREAGAMVSSSVVQRVSATSVLGAPVPTATVPRLRALPLPGRTRQAVDEARAPVVALTFAAPATVVVVVVAATAAAEGRGGLAASSPASTTPQWCNSAPIPFQWVLHQVKVHQHPEGETPAAASRWSTMKLCIPA
jgi:hypothetical protein